MTEQEIIKRLKDNKRIGTIFFFLPEDVRDYLLKHKNEKKTFLVFDTSINEWRLNPGGISCIDELIYALPDFKPHWEEFDVTDGYFTSKELEADYPYYNYIIFLNESKKHNAFGGWFFKQPANDKKVWTTSHQVKYEKYMTTLCDEDDDTEPIFPSKIRFWRFKE